MKKQRLVEVCMVPLCGRQMLALGMCRGHYARFKAGWRGPELLTPIRGKAKAGPPRELLEAIESQRIK